MAKLYLKQPGFTYCSREPSTKHCESIRKFRETGNLKHLYGNELYISFLHIIFHRSFRTFCFFFNFVILSQHIIY